jgi:hypothetical protein
LSISLQENLLVLLCFSKTAAPVIRTAIEPRLFGQAAYREIAARAFEYIDRFHEPPAEHLPDLFDEELQGDGPQAQQYGTLIEAMYDQRPNVNEQYALTQLEKFVRQQSLKTSIIAASEALQEGDLERADVALTEGLRVRMQAVQPPTTLDDGLKLVYAKQVRQDIIPTGIKELDRAQLGPARGEFLLFIAAPKRGKSWFLIHMGKQGILHRKKVLYVTLELSAAQIAGRMLQALFSVSRNEAHVDVTRFKADEFGNLIHFDRERIRDRLRLSDDASRPLVQKKLTALHGRNNFAVKQFPPGSLTVPQLTAYLDSLEHRHQFIPDMLIIDYPDYMKINSKSSSDYRIANGALYNDLRGIAVERNISVVVASKSNRQGTKARLIDETHAAEDYSRIYTADTVFTFSQAPREKKLGIARLFASNTRVGLRDGFVLIISQSYPIGQFCLDSVKINTKYEGLLEQAAEADDPAEESTEEDAAAQAD